MLFNTNRPANLNNLKISQTNHNMKVWWINSKIHQRRAPLNVNVQETSLKKTPACNNSNRTMRLPGTRWYCNSRSLNYKRSVAHWTQLIPNWWIRLGRCSRTMTGLGIRLLFYKRVKHSNMRLRTLTMTHGKV